MTQPEKIEPQATEVTVEVLEYTSDGEYGNAFLSAHEIPKNDPLWKRYGIEMTKSVKFERDLTPMGQKGAKLTTPVKDLSPEALKVLEQTPGYKRVKL